MPEQGPTRSDLAHHDSGPPKAPAGENASVWDSINVSGSTHFKSVIRGLNWMILAVAMVAALTGAVIVSLSYRFAKEFWEFYLLQKLGEGLVVTSLITSAAQFFLKKPFADLEQDALRLIRSRADLEVVALRTQVDSLSNNLTESINTTQAALQSEVDALSKELSGTLEKRLTALDGKVDGLSSSLTEKVSTSSDAVKTTLEAVTSDTKRELSDTLSRLEKELLEQTSKTAASAASLTAMQAAGMTRMYANRAEASKDIKSCLEAVDATDIRIIGVSLNDFLLDRNKDLHAAWLHLVRIIKSEGARRNGRELRIRVLLIDPRSNAAYLRAKAEEQGNAFKRLDGDVKKAIEYFSDQLDSATDPSITFEVRLYRTTPDLFLVWTGASAFVQQYYFRPSHEGGINIPVYRFSATSSEGDSAESMHRELGFHFEWIWQEASVSLKEWLKGFSRGSDSALRDARIVNVFYDRKDCRERMLRLIRCANERVWLKGISLISFFKRDSDLYDAIFEACSRGLDVRVLLLDPNCNQAKYRSLREFQLSRPGTTLDGFTDEERRRQKLYRETTDAMDFISGECIPELEKHHPGHRLQARLYDCAPEAFILLVDDKALVEQYNYGKNVRQENAGHGRKVLGGDVPVFEFEKAPGGASEDPFEIFRDHYEFAFEFCARSFDKAVVRPDATLVEQAPAQLGAGDAN